ncbi:MAG TPA: xanthine dehydrogenase family protein subunit M, partial [Limnochordia bacterium]
MHPFEYFAPTSVSEAIRLLAEGGDGARPLAGGTDLTTQMKEGRRRCDRVVDLKRIPELTQIAFDPQSGLSLGAAARCEAIYHHPAVRQHYPAVAASTSLIGSVQIQNRASLGGNLCNAAPSADGVPALIVHGAQAVIRGPDGTRRLPVEEVCTGPGRTCLAPGEILVAFELPLPPPRTASHYLRFIPRNEMDIAVAGVGASLTLDPTGQKCVGARIAL